MNLNISDRYSLNDNLTRRFSGSKRYIKFWKKCSSFLWDYWKNKSLNKKVRSRNKQIPLYVEE